MKKVLLGLLVSLCIAFVATPILAADNPFTDVNQGDWYYNAVIDAYNEGLFTGTSTTTFSPNDGMTRAMFVTVIGRLAGVHEGEFPSTSFSDVEVGMWYAPYVEWAYKSNIVNGTGNNQFSPNSLITREQMAKIIGGYIKGMEIPNDPTAINSFNDGEAVSAWASEGLEIMRRTGIIKGDNNGNFNPNNTATRAEGATIFVRLSEKLILDEGDEPLTSWQAAYVFLINGVNINDSSFLIYDVNHDRTPEIFINKKMYTYSNGIIIDYDGEAFLAETSLRFSERYIEGQEDRYYQIHNNALTEYKYSSHKTISSQIILNWSYTEPVVYYTGTTKNEVPIEIVRMIFHAMVIDEIREFNFINPSQLSEPVTVENIEQYVNK